MGSIFKGLAVSFEEIILVILIYLNIIDFLEIMPPELDYIGKILGWTAFGMLIYHVSPTKIFFGKKHKYYDFVIIFAYFLMIAKNLVGFSRAAVEGSSGGLQLFHEYVLAHANFFEINCLIIGFITIIILSIIFAITMEIYSPSTLDVIHERGKPPKNPIKLFLRALSIFIVLTGFFIVVFNLFMEWIAFAIAVPMVFIGAGIYFIAGLRFKKKFKASKIIYKAATFGENFYDHFLELFHTKKIYLGIIGMLVLHLITEVANFIIPYVINIHDEMYFAQFEKPHIPLYKLLQKEIMIVSSSEVIGLIIGYIANVIAILSFLLIPAYIWYQLSKKRNIKFNSVFHTIFFFTLSFFLFAPVFKFTRFEKGSIRGIDILTQEMVKNTPYTINSILIMSLILGGITMAISLSKFKPFIDISVFFISTIFFGNYIYLFFSDLFMYYIENISYLISSNELFIGIFMTITLLFTGIFYIGGFIMYVVSVITKN